MKNHEDKLLDALFYMAFFLACVVLVAVLGAVVEMAW